MSDSSNSPDSLSPLNVLDEARKAVPAVNYALGLAGVAAAAAIITSFVGHGPGAIIVIGASFVGMIILFIFSKLVVSTSPSIQFAGVVLVWATLAFFGTFLVLTTTAVIFTWPCNWAELLDMTSACFGPTPNPINRTDEKPAGPEPADARLTHFVITVSLSDGTVARREWSRPTPNEWVEKYSESGVETYYDIKGRITLDGCPGTKLVNETAPTHLVFIPDKKCPGMPFRINDNNAGWGIAAALTNYD